MKNYIVMIILTLTPFFTVTKEFDRYENEKQDSKQSSTKHIIPINESLPLDYEDDLFDSLTNWDSIKIVGLGEATHGTKEFSELKFRIFKYLVEKQGYKVLACEYNYIMSLEIEKYIVQGIGDIDSILKNSYWVQNNHEFKNVIRWMYNYNLNKKDQDKIHFIGIDSQVDIFYRKELESIFKEFDLNLYQHVCKELNDVINIERFSYRSITQENFDIIQNKLIVLKEKTKDYLANSQQDNKEQKRKILIHVLDCYIKSHQMLFNKYQKNVYLRDQHLSENAKWINEYLGYDTKYAIWAHNAHVGNDNSYLPDGNGSMGYYLRNEFGKKYFIIGTAFSKGKFIAVITDSNGKDTKPEAREIKDLPQINSHNDILDKLYNGNFILQLNKLSAKEQLFHDFNQNKPFLGVGDLFLGSYHEHYIQNDRSISLTETFDIIFYFKETGPISF